MPRRGHLRASDEDREQIADRLRRAAAVDHGGFFDLDGNGLEEAHHQPRAEGLGGCEGGAGDEAIPAVIAIAALDRWIAARGCGCGAERGAELFDADLLQMAVGIEPQSQRACVHLHALIRGHQAEFAAGTIRRCNVAACEGELLIEGWKDTVVAAHGRTHRQGGVSVGNLELEAGGPRSFATPALPSGGQHLARAFQIMENGLTAAVKPGAGSGPPRYQASWEELRDEETLRIVEPSAAALAAAIVALLEDPRYAEELGARGARFAAEEMGVARTAAALDRLLASQASRARA